MSPEIPCSMKGLQLVTSGGLDLQGGDRASIMRNQYPQWLADFPDRRERPGSIIYPVPEVMVHSMFMLRWRYKFN